MENPEPGTDCRKVRGFRVGQYGEVVGATAGHCEPRPTPSRSPCGRGHRLNPNPNPSPTRAEHALSFQVIVTGHPELVEYAVKLIRYRIQTEAQAQPAAA